MSKKNEINKKENEKFNESMLLMKRERDLCIDGAKKVNKNLNDIEKVYHDESYDIILANEAAQMERLLSSVEINSLKACSALEEVNNELSKLALEQISDPKRDELLPQGGQQNGQLIEEFLSAQDSEVLQRNTKIKMEAAAARLKDIFLKATKQYNHVLATFSSVSQDQHDHHDHIILHNDGTTSTSTITNNNNNNNNNNHIHDNDRHDIEDHQISHITNLQKKIKELKKELEIAEMKSRSVIVQRGVDLQKAKEEKARYEAETKKLLLKLQLSESKRRFHEQLGRDENHSTTLVSPMEYEEVQRECQELKEQIIALQDEAVKREQTILQLTQELATTQHNFQTSEYNKNKIQSKVDELSKKEKYSQDRIDDIVREYEKKFNDLEINFENELRDYRSKLKDYENVTKEKMRLSSHVLILEEEEKKMKTQSKEFMTQLTDARKRITTLEEQIITQENEYAKTLQLLEVKLMEKALERAMTTIQERTLSQQNSTVNDPNNNNNNNLNENDNNDNDLNLFDDDNKNNNDNNNNNDLKTKEELKDSNDQINLKVIELESQIEKLKQENDNFQQEINKLNDTINNPPVQYIEKPIPIEVTKEIIPDNVKLEIQNLNSTIDNLNKLLLNKDKEHELNIKSLSQQHTSDIDNITTKLNTLQSQYDQLQQQYKELSSLTDNESSDSLEPALKIKQMKLNTKGRKLSGSSGNNHSHSRDDIPSSLLSPTNKKEISIQTDETFHNNNDDNDNDNDNNNGKLVDQVLQTDEVFILSINERENELKLHQKDIDDLKLLLNRPKSSKKSNRMLSMQSSSFQFNEIDSYDWNDENNDNDNDESNDNNNNNENSDNKTNNDNNSSSISIENNQITSQQQHQQKQQLEPTLHPLSSKEVYDMIEKITNEHFDKLLSSETFDSLFTPLKEENNEKKFQQTILNLFLHPINGLMHQHIIEHEQKKGKKHKIHDIVTCVLDMMDQAILKYLEVSHFEETRAELESKVDLVINLENEMNKLQSELDNALLTVNSTKSALSALSIDMPSSANSNKNDSRVETPEVDLLKKNLSFSGIDLLKLKPDHRNKPLDDISSTRSLESNDDYEHNQELSKRMNELDSHILDSEKHIIKHAKDEILSLKNELDDLQNEYNILSEKYNILLEEKRKYESIFNDMNNSIPFDERSGKSGFDFSKYLALASTDNQDEPKKSRAQTLLELTKPRSIDRTQAINLSKSSSSSLPSSALPTQRRDSKQLKNIKNQNTNNLQYNSIVSVSEDDDISLLDDPDFNDYSLDDDVSTQLGFNNNNNNNNNDKKLKDNEKYLIAKQRKLLRDFLKTDKYGSETELTESLGMIKSEHFDKLINGPFGGNDLIHLTRLEFYHRSRHEDDGDNDTINSYNNDNDDMSQSSDNISNSGLSARKSYKNIKMNSNYRKKVQQQQQSSSSLSSINYKNNKILQKAAEIEIGAQRKLVIEHYPISELAKFLHATESTLLKLTTFSVWKRIKFATAGGMFHDILVVHRDSINRCIAAAGGYTQAMLTVQVENKLTSETNYWPEFFRVKVLEYYRKELLSLKDTHEKEIQELQDTVVKLRNDLQEEKELITQERAWALKEISSMSVHLQKRLVMSRASTFNEVDIKELSDALGEPHSGDNDDDDYFKDSTQSTPLNTTSTNSVSTPTKKIKKSVMFQDPTGLNFSTRLYEENSSFYLKAQEIHKSLKAKQFFKRIVHSHSLLQSYQRRHSSFDEFSDNLSDKNNSITTTPNTSMSENDDKNDHNDHNNNNKNKLKMKVRQSKNDSDNDTRESNSILETVEEKKGEEDEIKEQKSNEVIPNVSIVELLSKSKDDKDNDNDGDNDGDETDLSDHDEVSEVVKQGISPPRSNQPLIKRNNSRVIEQITINIPQLLYQLQDIALAIYRNGDRLAAQLAQKLTSVLYNWEESDHTPTSLSACLTLCRPNTSDIDCISLLRDFALSTECNLKLVDLTPVREVLHDALIYYESKNGSPTKARPPTIQQWSNDEHDINSNNSSHNNSNDNYDKISTPKSNTSSHQKSTSPTISSRKMINNNGNNGLCNLCGRPLQKSLSGEKTPSESARDSEDETMLTSRSSMIISARNQSNNTTPGRRKSSHQLNQQSISSTPTASPKHSPRRKIDNTEYIKKKKMHKKSINSGGTTSTSTISTSNGTLSSAVKEDLLEELIPTVESKACQTESLENVIISYTHENIIQEDLIKLSKKKDDIPSGELMLVKLAHNIWDSLKNPQDFIQESFSSYGVEISPGVRLISNYILIRKESTLNPNDPDGPKIQSQEFDLKRLPLGVVLVRKRKASTHLFKGIVEWSDWDTMGISPPDLPDDIITVALPPVLEISPAVQLLTSGQMNYFIEIPTDVWVINILRDPKNRVATTFMAELDVLIPSGFLMVKLSPTLIVSKELQKRLPEGVKLAEIDPHEMIKLHGRYTLLPPGYMLCPGIMVAAPECSPPPREEYVHLDEILTIKNSSMLNDEIKRDIYNKPTDNDDLHIENLYPMVLPPGIIAIYIDNNSIKELPSYLKLLKCENETIDEEQTTDDVEIGVDQDINTYLQRGSIIVLQYPKNLILPQGTLLIKRPKSLHGIPRPLPPTMSLCPPSMIPDRLILKDGIELVMLSPIYELPSGIHITPESVIYPRPTGLKLPPRGILVRRSPGAYIPHEIILGNVPPIPYGIYLPPEIELWILPKGLRLPPKAELTDGIYISDYLPPSGTFDDSKYDGIYFIKRDIDYLQSPLPYGFERALKQHLPIGCLLPPGVEAIRLRPRYELPAGILIQSGAQLGKDIQLPPGSEIYPNVEVVEWSQGMYLPQNIELVRRIDRDVGLPNDLTIVQETSNDFQNNDTSINNIPPRGCFFIRLPHKINLPSALELADRCMIVNFKNNNNTTTTNNNNNNNNNDLNKKIDYTINLPENVIGIKRVPPSIKSSIELSPMGNIPLPPELTPFPPSLIPKDLHLPAGVELVYVHTRYDLPVGTILTGGIVVHSRCEVGDGIPLELTLTTKSLLNNKDVNNNNNKDNNNKDNNQKNKLKFKMNPKVSSDSLITVPIADLKENLQAILLTKINEHILSWGENCQDLNPIDPPSSMVKLPEGYFLINSSKDGKNLSKLPPSLEIVHDLSPLPHGITLPPRVIVIRLKPKIILPFGIRLSNPNLSTLQNVHLCPGEPLTNPQTEISYHQSTVDDSQVHILISDPLNVSKPFKEVEIQTQSIVFPSLLERLKSWFKYSRLNNVGISTRGHGGTIYGVIPPPIHQFNNNNNDELINRTPSTPMYSQTRRAVSRTTSRMSDFAADSEDFDNDLLEANEQIEKLNESLDESMKENRILKKTIEALTKDYESMKSKSIRMEQSRDDMMDECNNMKSQLETIKAKEKKDESAYRIKMSELMLANKNLNFTIQEHEDTIKSLKKTVDHMKVNGSMTEKEKEKEFRKREVDLINARDEAISEYRKLLKIAIRTAYQLVRAVISTAEKDQHSLTFTSSLSRQQNNIFREEYPINDDVSQLTLEDNIDEMSIGSMTQGDLESNSSPVQPPPPELIPNTTRSSGRSSQSRLPQLSAGRPNSLQPIFRTGNNSNSGNNSSNSNNNGNNNGLSKYNYGLGDNTSNLLITGKIGKKREVKSLLTSSQSTPSIVIHDNPSYALASSIVDKLEQQDNISLGTPSIQSKSQKTIGGRSQTSYGGSRSSNGPFLTSSATVNFPIQSDKNLLSSSTPLPLSSISGNNSNNNNSGVSISGTALSSQSTLRNNNNNNNGMNNNIPLKEHNRDIELLDKEVLHGNTSTRYHTLPPSESDLALISPNKFLEDLEKTFATTKKQVTVNDNGDDITSTILVYVVDTASADSIASEWLKNAVSLVVSAISSTLGNYISAFHLIESEIECHISERKRLHKKLQYVENLYQDYLTSCDIPIEKRLQFRLDEINKAMLDMYSHTENIRNLSYQTILEALKTMTSNATNYLEQEKRLKLSSIIVKKKALLEETKLKRGTFDEKERIAITHYINSLKKRSVILLSRANTVNEQFQSISNSIKKEFESLEGAVQGILPPNLISKILQWSTIHMQRSLRDPYIQSTSTSINNISNEMKNESLLSSSSELTNNNGGNSNGSNGGNNSNNNNNNTNINTNTSNLLNNSSTNFHQKLSLNKPSPNLYDQMIPKDKLSKITELNELSGPRKGLPSVKPDPFNRYFTSNEGLSSSSNSLKGLKK